VLGEAIGDLLPSAVAIALSPIPVVAVVLVLGAPRARTAGPAFALGWIAGLVAVTVVLVLALGAADDPDSGTATAVHWLKVALGVLLLVLAAGQFRDRPRDGEQPKAPGWMASVDTMTAPRAGLLGAALSSVNPKNLVLVVSGAAAIAQAGLDGAGTAIAVAVFVAIASAVVCGSVLAYLADAERAERPLSALRRFMSDNNAVIMTVVLLLLGAKLLGDGIGEIWP
jgi:threonine/homoserine/homoserine lactone efflux protein